MTEQVPDLVLATGIALVVNARVRPGDLDDSWSVGPTPLHCDEEETLRDRLTAFAPPLPRLLYGRAARWHRQPVGLSLFVGDTAPFRFDVVSVEVLAVSPEALPQSSLDIGVVIVHIVPAEEANWRDLPLAVREGLREKQGHDAILDKLESELQPGAIQLAAHSPEPRLSTVVQHSAHSLSGAWLDRDIRPIYPVFTLPDAVDGDPNPRVLRMRELATGEPIGFRDDKDTSGRLARAKEDLTVFNDSAEAMVLRFGTTFSRPSTSDISSASLQYLVSAQYVDLVALSRLEALALAEYARTASAFAGRAGVRAEGGYTADNLLDLTQLRLRLLSYDTSYGKSAARQSRTHSAIIAAARERVGTRHLREEVRQDIAGLVEASKLQDEVEEDRQRRRSNRLNATFATLVAIFSLVTVPQAVVEIARDVYGLSGAGLQIALWSSFAAIGGIVVLVGVWAVADLIRGRRERRRFRRRGNGGARGL